MKVLWIVNSPFPEALRLFNGSIFEKKGSGGWQMASANNLVKVGCEKLFVASPCAQAKEVLFLNGQYITYILIPVSKNLSDTKCFWKNVSEQVEPDVVHIHGTEYLNGYHYIIAGGTGRIVVSLQGVVSEIAKYYNAGLSKFDILMSHTLYETIRRSGLYSQQKSFIKKGEVEKMVLNSVSNVIGRTEWDKCHSLTINPNLHYYKCNESLRDEFYEGIWSYERCNPHTIFLSQGTYPVKGLHIFLKALYIVQKKHPDVRVRIAGPDFLNPTSIKDKIKRGGYAKIVDRILRTECLEDFVTFTGPLNAEEMKIEYLNANIFVSPSTIENSPNSLGEAQILGVPCIASFVGGTPDFIPNDACGKLYRYDDVEQLAYLICEMFEKSKSFDNTTMRSVASQRHDRMFNAEKTLQIYQSIINL